MNLKKEQNVNFRATAEFAARLALAAALLDVPASQIVREAVSDRLDRLAERHPSLKSPDRLAVEGSVTI